MGDSGEIRQPMLGWLCKVMLVPLGFACAQAQEPPREAEQDPQALHRELESMKGELQQMQDRMRRQQELIDELAAKKKGLPPGRPGARPVTAAQPAQPAPEEQPKPEQTELEEKITENVLDKIQPALAAANKTFPSQFNPAIGLIIDTAFSWKQNEGNNFEFRAAELGVSANIDPFARGFAIITGSPDGFEVEEAGIVTTSLPYNLTLKAGRYFADFGRLSKFHDHDLPFVNRPIVLDRFVGGESQSDGVEVSWLAPGEHYITLTLGAYNKLGAENTRVDNTVPRDLGQFTYLARLATFINLGESISVDLGATYTIAPRVEDFTDPDGVFQIRNGKPRHLAAVDVTFRWIPLAQSQYHGFIWGTEVLYNQENWDLDTSGDPALAIFKGRDAWGMYSYVEARLTRRYYAGFLFDYAQDLTRETDDTKAYSPYFTIWLSEFNRLRLQYTYLDEPANHENQFFVQWTAILGSHVHGFRDR